MPINTTLLPRVSYSQNGEDILIDRVFGTQVGTFMDLGACHPRWDNNTSFFHQRGWRGTNVEPNPKLLESFLEERPEDRNIGVAVSDRDGELTFFDLVDNIGLSTLSAEVAAEHARNGFEVVPRVVQVRRVETLIQEYSIPEPDFLSLDVEAHEAEVLDGIPLDHWRPKLLVIESTLPRTTIPCHQKWEQRLFELGYIFATFNGVNRFYLRDDLRDKLECLRIPVNAVDDFLRAESVDLRRELDSAVKEIQRAHGDIHRLNEYFGHFEWARQQSELAQAAWHREREEFDRQRTQFELERTQFAFERTQSELERAKIASERAGHAEFLDAYNQEQTRCTNLRAENDLLSAHLLKSNERIESLLMDIGKLAAQIDHERAAWEANHASLVHQISDTQRTLRPYTMIDRFGVVTSSYDLARKIKLKMASELVN